MTIIDILILAIALSIDAAVVSFAYGLILEENRRKSVLSLASFTGGFQFLMPLLGFGLAYLISDYVSPLSHWLVFVIFLLLGLNIIKEAITSNKSDIQTSLTLKCLLMIAIATSIDAFTAGASMAFLNVNIFLASSLIGITTFTLSFIGFICGKIFKNLNTIYLEIFAGILLILLAFKSLLT